MLLTNDKGDIPGEDSGADGPVGGPHEARGQEQRAHPRQVGEA